MRALIWFDVLPLVGLVASCITIAGCFGGTPSRPLVCQAVDRCGLQAPDRRLLGDQWVRGSLSNVAPAGRRGSVRAR